MRDDEVILGVDLGGTTVSAGLVDGGGEVRAFRSVGTYAGGAGPGVLENLVGLVQAMAADARAGGLRVAGIGMGVPGVVDMATGTVGEDVQNVPEFKGFPLRDAVRDRVGLATVLDNDVNALALGEMYFGQARGVRNFVLIALGTGVGGGIVLDGELHRGVSGYGGEIGHIPIDLEGRQCFCGGRGCLKAYVSGPDIADQARWLLGDGKAGGLLDLVGGDDARVTAREVFLAAEGGDADCRALVEKIGRYLGAGIASVMNLLNPELIVLGGGVMEAGEALLAPARRWAEYYAFPRAYAAAKIVRSRFDKRSGIVGPAALYLYEVGRGRGQDAPGINHAIGPPRC